MMANAIQPLDPMAPWPLEDWSLPETSWHNKNLSLTLRSTFPRVSYALKRFAYRPLGPRSVTKERAPTERNSSWKRRRWENVIMLCDVHFVRVFVLKLLPCCDHSCRTNSPAGHSGTPRGISAVEKQFVVLQFSSQNGQLPVNCVAV